jgi:NOL1/NOP2/fmu family ribosome biogenesis protein
MAGQGFLLCNEWSPKRAKILSQNIERMGVGNALVTNETADRLAAHLPEFFDRVLIDAPCSGEGMFRKEEAAITDWSQETVEMCAQRQAEILDAGAKLVRPGGRLVYSTCTFAPEENELTIQAFLQRNPDYRLENASAPWFTPAGIGQFRLWPHKLLGEGHFAAVLRKNGDSEAEGIFCAGQKLPKEWSAFAKEVGITLPAGKAILFGQNLYWAPEQLPELKGLKVLRPGLELGEIKKDRFQPAHALALWLKNCATTVSFPADSQQIKRYMHGETIPCETKGWCLVQVDGYSIGWGKGDGKILKNHYPKGLRR